MEHKTKTEAAVMKGFPCISAKATQLFYHQSIARCRYWLSSFHLRMVFLRLHLY